MATLSAYIAGSLVGLTALAACGSGTCENRPSGCQDVPLGPKSSTGGTGGNPGGNPGGDSAAYLPHLAVIFGGPKTVQSAQAAFYLTLPDSARSGGMRLVLAFSGAAVGADTIVLPRESNTPELGLLTIPANASDGILSLTVSLPTLKESASATITIKDTAPPVITSGTVLSGFGGFEDFSYSNLPNRLLIANTTDTLAFAARDNHRLAWVGWRLAPSGGLADSVGPLSSAADSVNFPIAVPASLVGDSLGLTLFATDADGNRSTVTLGGLSVASLTTHPMQSTPRGARVLDIAFDTPRGLLYLAQPDSQQVAVLALNGMVREAPIHISGRPVAVDLTPGGDSLIVGLASPPAVAVVDLTSSARPVIATVTLDSTTLADTLESLRVAADDRAIAYIGHFAGSTTLDVELNLTTGVFRTIDSSTTGGCTERVTASVDRTHIMLLNCPSPAGGASTIYESATHTYTSAGFMSTGGGGDNMFTGGSESGSVYQFQHILIDPTVTAVFGGGLEMQYGAAVAPNGRDFYAGDSFCTQRTVCPDSLPGLYLHYSRPGPEPLELTMIPHPAFELSVSPTGNTLVGITADTIVAVDLTHSTPALPAVVDRFRRLLRSAVPHSSIASHPIAKSPSTFMIELESSSHPAIVRRVKTTHGS